MAFYIVTGKLGSGKSLICVSKIKERLMNGCRVATNLDLFVENLLPPDVQNIDLTRLPNIPDISDLEILGLGSDVVADESKFGLIVLDEGSGNFNARDWSNSGRKEMIDWLKHSRKLRWDVYIIVQSVNMLDKQIRESFGEHLVTCKRLDRLPIPFVSSFFRLLSLSVRAPKIHVGVVRYGLSSTDLIVQRWFYRGTSLYSAYDTEQIFNQDNSPAIFSYLPPYTIKGQFMSKFKIARLLASSYLLSAFLLGSALTGTYMWWHYSASQNKILNGQIQSTNLFKPTESASEKSIIAYTKFNNSVQVILSDGTEFSSQQFTISPSGITVTYNGKTYTKGN